MATASSGIQIIDCKCKVGAHKFQDEKYGVGKRVANVSAKGELRCTCCCKTRKSVRQNLAK